jgi:hypothetical protein
VHRSAAFVGIVLGLGASPAFAEDPHDLFGLSPKKPVEEEKPPDPLDPASPFGLFTRLTGDYLQRLPVGDTTVDGVAHWALGASRDETGPVFGGATGLENRWTIEGAAVDSIRTNASDIRVPLLFVQGITIGAGGWTARDRVGLGGSIDVQLVRGGDDHEVRTAVFGGMSTEARQRLIAPGRYFVRRVTSDAGPEVNTTVVATGPIAKLAGGKVWYALGIAPTAGESRFTWLAARITDRDQDGFPDGYPNLALEGISRNEESTVDWLVPFLARVGWDRGPHAIDLTLVGHGATSTRFLGNATIRAAGVDRTELVGTGIATYRGTWKNTRVTAQLSWHRSDRDESPHDPAANVPQLLSAYVPEMLAEDPALAAACNDNAYPLILQCAVPQNFFASAGAGLLVHSVGDRTTASTDVAHRVDNHVLRVGATFEDVRLVQRSRYTGGSLVRSLFDGHTDVARFYTGGLCGENAFDDCDYVDVSELRYRTRYTAAYVEDTWSPEEAIRVDGGLRWEMMWVGPQLHFSRQLAPRGGMSWDFLGKGRSRAWVSGGRTFAYLPTGLGASIIARDAIVHDIVSDLGGQTPIHVRDRERGAVFPVPSYVKPMAQDELTAGVEVSLAKAFRVRAWLQGRYLRYGLETTNTHFLNPGHNDGLPARRSSEILGIEVATEPTAQLTVRLGYMAGRTIGNYLGPWDPQQGTILYDGEEFDTKFSTGTDMGHLPTEVGHRVYIEAARRGKVGPVTLHFGTRMTLATGRPRSVFAATDAGYFSLIERGSVGNAPLLTQANVRLGATWRGFDLTLDVFNVFDRDEGTGIDELYTESFVRPIQGGSYEDLVFLKTTGNQAAIRRSGYGMPFAFQSPLSAMLGIRRAF